ncbi:GNAT family N-acetyltransferase [Streptomyces physcomitrii]|uniref:GNAT family N-acetyltransferase n=1 Tax=Streptomyces physcomitrii TaxID=2724184 RepID=UPI00343263D6
MTTSVDGTSVNTTSVDGTRAPAAADGSHAASPGSRTSSALTVVQVAVSDPLAAPLLRELADEYTARYGPEAHRELARYPDTEFAPPHGVLLLLLADGRPVAGGAFRRYDARTAEVKRVWTHSAHRRRGLARRVLTELEQEAATRGYTRLYLTTGPRQPEAKNLYLTAGYTPLYDPTAAPEDIGPHPFEKELAGAG